MSPIITTTVGRPAAEVFHYATDPTPVQRVAKGVTDGHMDQAGSPRVGAICSTTRRIGGANRPSTSRLTHIDPPKTWGVHGIDGPIRETADRDQITTDH